MSKLISAAVLATIAMVLTGCSNASSNQDSTSAEPAASSSASASPSASASASASPSASPSQGPSPAAVPSTAPAAEPTPEPTSVASEPVVEEQASEPAFTSPPVTEPEAQPVVGIITPDPEWDAAQITVEQGASFTINGSGYEPGTAISINLGIAQSDGMVMEEQTVVADSAGSYSFTMTIEADLDPGKYVVLTYNNDAHAGPEFEASKRFASVNVIPAS